MMTIINTISLNKRVKQITFNSGRAFNISIYGMFEVDIFEKEKKVGSIRFSALSSLNNLSMRPLYNLEESAVKPEFDVFATDLYVAAIGHFQEFTNGRIQLPYAL